VLDSRRCISYLTIEQRGPIPADLSAALGTHVYGCDICQDVCPWNQIAPRSGDPAWRCREVWTEAPVARLADLSDAELRSALRGSAMKRTRVDGLRRNLEVARQNAEIAAEGRR
jgi:epoxyqueuosine reductase